MGCAALCAASCAGTGAVTEGAAACAAIVARDDPHLHATALFAPEPGRSRLMVLYAFDIELSRAAAASAEPMIARMRLQWWRDTVEGARAGAPSPAHEVAGPFARLAAEQDLPADLVEPLIAAREAELDGPPDAGKFAAWAEDRFGALAALAAYMLTGGDAPSVALALRSGLVRGTAFALRNAAAMARENIYLLPGLDPEDRARLAQGETTDHARSQARQLAGAALERLAELRAERRRLDRRAIPALLPLRRAGRVLGRASGPAVGLGDLGRADRPFEGLGLAWAAATGRW